MSGRAAPGRERGNPDVRDKLKSASRKAAEARARALETSDPRVKDEWGNVARMWEELANEYRELNKVRPPNQ